MECTLHIAYRLDIKVFQTRGHESKDKFNIRKKYIQRKFKNELGLLADMSTQKTGKTNDYNTTRRFSRDAVKSA